MALRCIDLMIGDLLTFKDCVGDSGFPILKVNGILPDTLFVRIDYSDADDEVDYEDISGIPLTPEILEKNGFESDTNMFGFADYELSKDYILENRGDRFCISRRVNNSGSTYWILTIFFVHQLQHALRLYGIEKEIVI